MKKMWKRFVSLLLACTLLAGMLPLSASAQATAPGEEELTWVTQTVGELNDKLTGTVLFEKKGAIPIQGSDLYAVQYQRSYSTDVFITETILFIVPGKDADLDKCIIPNTDSTNSVWANSGAIGLYIADGVTEIGNHAFDGMSTLETVEFQDSTKLTKVGEYAFNNCDKMVGLSLDLSNVTTLGKYAFNGCERLGSGENNKGVTLNDALTTIPENAFNTCGLKNVNIPKSCTKIEKNAFAHNSLSEVGELVLPDGLVTIGDSAFVVTMGSGETGIGITSLTIPSSVKSIGANAFSGRRNLAEVTVEDDNNPGTTLTLGDHAFGYNESSAFSEWGSITDAANITYTGNLGTEFHLPADIAQSGVFENGKTCYTGDISPMTYDTTLEPTCTTAGYHQYKTTISGAITENGEPVEVQYRVPLGALGHKWGEIKEVGASCERDGYFYQDCVRTDCEARTSTIEGSTGLFDTETGSALTPEEMEDYTPDEAEGHTYRPDRIEAPILAASQKTVLHYVCKNPKHDDERDSTTKDYPFTLQGKTLFATTTDTLNDLTSQLTGFSSSGIVSWDVEGNQLSQEFGEEGTKYVNVKFTPKNAGVFTDNVFSKDSSGTHLQITIQVKKAVVDLSGFSFSQNAVSMDQLESATVTASGFGGDAKQDGKIEFYNPAGGTWASEMPTEIGGDYKVRVPFSYETSKFRLPTDSEDEYPQDGSKIVTENGKNYLVHDFAIIIQSINATVRAKQNLVYDGTEKTTVSVSSLRENCHVAFYLWENDDWVQKGTYTSTKAGDSTEGISLKNAGTYKVKVEITLDQFETQTEELEVTIAKAPVQKPVAKENLQYLPKETQQGFESLGGEDELYIITGGTGVDAKTYTATATLNDSANYCWQGENASTATVQIPWTILPQRLTKPNANSARDYSYQYGQYREPLTTTAGNNYDVDRNEETGLKGVYYIGNQENEGYEKEYAYTVTNSWMTDAKEYTSVVHLNDNKNYVWHDGSSDDVTIHWEIRKATLELPNVTVKTEAKNVPYDGEAYEEANIIVAEKTLPGDVVPGAYEYARNEQFSGATENAPTDAGDYFVRRSYTYNADNYAVVGSIPFASFTITPAEATMTFTEGEETATYTAQGTPLQQVKVTNLVTVDVGKPASDVYNVTYTYKYRTDSSTTWEEVNTETKIEEPNSFKFTDVGEYQITATFSSNNYTATPAIYTLTIEKANAQKITLTSAGTNKGQWNEENKTYTTTYGAEASFTITGTAALDAENAAISYEVTNDGANVVSVDSGSGMVTIKQAGEATITVTAADTDNVGAASVEYTVTVNRAEPKLELNEGHAAYTGSEVAEDTYKKATLSGAGEGYAHPDGTKLAYYFYEYNANSQNTVLEDTENENALKTIPSSVGDYWLKVVFPGDACYSDAAAVAKFTITPAELSVSATGHTGTYDGKTHSAITIKSVTGNGTTLAQGQYTVKYAKTNTNIAPGADAGDDVWQDDLTVKDVADSSSDKLYYWYMVTADNYNPAIGKVEVKITPAPLTVTGEPASYEKEYDGDKEVDEALTDITVTAEDVPEVTIDVDATGTYVDKDAGTEKDVTLILSLTLSGTDGANIDWGNYSYGGKALTEGKITLTKAGAGTITPKAISVTGISAVDRVYDGTTKVQLTGTPGTTEGSFIGGDNVSFSAISDQTGTVTDAKAEDGKTVTVAAETLKGLLTGEDAKNYTVTQASTTTVNITKRPVTLQFPNRNDGTTEMTAPYSPQGLIVAHSDVYKVSAKTADDSTGFVGEDALAENDIQYTFTQDEQTVEKPINVGKYTVNAALTSEAAEKWSNYTIKAITGTVEIIQATEELTVTVTGKTGLTYTGQGQDPIQSISVQGGSETLKENEGYTVKFRLTDSGEYALDRNALTAAVKDAKEYTVYWQVTTTNYGNETGSFNVTVDPATLTLSSDLTKEKKYDGATEAVVTGQKVTGAQNNESITVSSVSAAYDDANVDTDKTITTTYTVTFGADVTPGNYTYTGNVEGKATSTWTIKTTVEDGKITQAPITVAINDQKKVYDGQSLSIENPVQDTHWSTTGTIYLQDGVKDDLGITLSIASGSKDAGTYAITGAASNQNYEVTFTGSWTGEDDKGKAGTYTISPRPINVQIGDAEGFYGDVPDLTLETKVILTPETAQGENAGLVEGENIYDALEDLSLSSDATVSSPVREDYTIYPLNNGVVDQDKKGVYGNYDVTFTKEGTYTVKPRPITITISDAESDYGCDLAQLTYSKTLSEAYTGTNKGVVFVGDDETDLKIALFTTAKKGSDAGTYSISGKVSDGDVSENYSITWAGETSWNGSDQDSTTADSAKGTYTIDKAQLKVSVKRSDIYAQYGEEISNPVTFTNASTGQEIASDASDYTALSQAITYGMEPQGGLTQVEGSENAEGKFTVAVTQQMVTVTVNVAATENYEAATEITYHIHASASGSLDVSLPFADLTYNGQPQQLLAQAPELPDGVYIRYKVGESGEWTAYSDKNQDNWKEVVGENAGSYTVYWETTSSGNYNASSGNSNTSIAKANLEGSFAHDSYPHVLATDGNNYDSAEKNPLTITSQNYKANPANYTYYSDNMKVASSANGTSTIVITGTAGESATIRVTVPGDNNYNEGTFTYRLEISDDLSKIVYSVGNQEVTYNGQPQTIAVNVTAPASGATVMYWNEETKAYDLSEPPAYTDVQDDGYTIKFQITAPGYEIEEGTATLTINPKPIKENMIAGIAESYTYTGKEITFDDAISVHDEGVLLKQNTDYTVSYDQNTAVGTNTGSVTITGMGNYKESVTKNFTISPVDASDLTASLNRTFGYYRNSENNNATVTVTHGGHTVDSREIALTVTRQDSTIESGDVVKEGLKLTFNKAGIYTIHVVVAGTHTGAFDLTYTLLPQDVASDDFQVATDPVDRVWTYDGGNHAFGVTVTSGGTPLQKDVDFTLRYTYLPYVGSQEESKYDPESTEFTEAGIYTVIVEGTGNYTGHAELVALIQPRDLSDAGITAAFAQTELVYNGEAQEPGVTLTYNGTAITQLKDTEYYGNTNAGEAQALSAASAGCNNFTGARVDAFTIEKKSLNDSTITAKADPEEYYYTGHPVTPAVTVTDSGRNVDLSIGADYTVTSDAVGPGKVNATVTGTGNYTDMVTVEFTILPTGAEPVETLDLTVTPSEWTWDNGKTKAAISVTFNGKELNDTDYQLTVSKDGETPRTVTKEQVVELLSAPGTYTITATGVGAYNGSTDTETVTIQKIQPEVTVTATPNSLSGGGKVTLTLKGEKLPAFAEGQDLSSLLTASAKDEKNAPDLSELEWETDKQTGVMTAELTLPNTSETYTFTLTFTGNEYYEAATASEQVVVAQQIISGGGGGPVEDQPADPDDTGVSDWLNTKDHLAYLAGYPGGTFGPDQNMTRAEAAQMFYNLLLEKDVEITVEFEDVPADAWYAKPVNTLASLGILSGVGNGRFDPERSITRAEFTVIAMKFANTSGGGVNIFSDVNEDDWFYSAVVDSTQYGWINGYPDGTFRPEATISRAEVTVIVNHMLGRAADRPYVIAHEEELNTFGDVNRGHWGYFHIAEATNAHEYHTEDGTESWTGLS